LVAVAPQDVFLFDASIMENLKFGDLDAGEDEIIDPAKKIGVHQFISKLPNGYRTRVGEEIVQLSGGKNS